FYYVQVRELNLHSRRSFLIRSHIIWPSFHSLFEGSASSRMLQWMGGSRRKVANSRKSTQKRQKQYFEQRKRQQQYLQQTAGIEPYADGIDTSGEHHREHQSLDILSLLNLSKIAQEHKARCPTGRKDLEGNASEVDYNIMKDSPAVLSGPAVPSNSIKFMEARIPSGFQDGTASPKKFSSSDHGSHDNGFVGDNSKPDQCKAVSEQQFSVLDLIGDDGMNGNVEGNQVHEGHVAFSVEGLGKVGMETPVRSPQQCSKTFYYGRSSPLKAAGRSKSSKNLNSLLDSIEFEDAMMQDTNVPFSHNSSEFSADIMDPDPLSSLKQKPFTVRDGRQADSCSSKYSYFDHLNEDKWDAGSISPDYNFFDDRVQDKSWKSSQRRISNNSSENVLYRNYDVSDFDFEGLHQPIRASAEVKDKFDVLEDPHKFGQFSNTIRESSALFSKHQTSEYDPVVSNWRRQPTVQRNFDFRPVTRQPDRFCFSTEDARDNVSSLSEESCSSSAVRGHTTENLPSNSTPRQSKRGHENAFVGSGDNYCMRKAFSNETQYRGNDDIQDENIACGSVERTKVLNSSKLKQPSHHSNSFYQEKLGPKDNWFFEEEHTTVDTKPSSSSFHQSSGTKHTSFESNLGNEDPFSESFFHGFKHSEPFSSSLSDGFNLKKDPLCDSPIISKPDFSPNFDFQGMPLDSSHIAASPVETPSPVLSGQESASKDVGYKAKFQPVDSEKFELGEEFCFKSEAFFPKNKVETDVLISKNNDQADREAKVAASLSMGGGKATSYADPVEEASQSVDISYRSDSKKDEKEDHYEDKIPFPHHHKWEEEVEDIEGRRSSKQKIDYIDTSCQVMMLQSYVFQLFSVQKVLKEASTNSPLKKA
ncbi:hypothetical protein UlMin_012962, partial [Ulmus minor]